MELFKCSPLARIFYTMRKWILGWMGEIVCGTHQRLSCGEAIFKTSNICAEARNTNNNPGHFKQNFETLSIDFCRCEFPSIPHLVSVSFCNCKVILCSFCRINGIRKLNFAKQMYNQTKLRTQQK